MSRDGDGGPGDQTEGPGSAVLWDRSRGQGWGCPLAGPPV